MGTSAWQCISIAVARALLPAAFDSDLSFKAGKVNNYCKIKGSGQSLR
jgi:hypothetical protein